MVWEIQRIINHNSKFSVCFWRSYVDEPNWKVKLWWNDGFDETTSGSVLARLSWRWWSFIQHEMSARQAEMWAAIIRMESEIVECHQHSSDMKSHVSERQNLVMTCRQKREVVQELSPVAPQQLDFATWTPHLSKIPWRTYLRGKLR